MVWPQRGKRSALSLPWLEIRSHRPVYRGPLGTGGEWLLQEDQAQILSPDRTRRLAVDLHGAAGKPALRAGVGVCLGPTRTALRLEADAGMQLAAGHGGWHRFEPRFFPAPRRTEL